MPGGSRCAAFPPARAFISKSDVSRRRPRRRRRESRHSRLGQQVGHTPALVGSYISIRKQPRPSFLGGGVETVSMRVSIAAFVSLLVVPMFPWTVGVSMPTKDAKTDQVRGQSQATDNQDKLGVGDFRWVNEARERFENDRYAERNEEDGVEKGTENLGPEPLRQLSAKVGMRIPGGKCSTHPVGKLVRGGLFGHRDSPQAHEQRDDVVELVCGYRSVNRKRPRGSKEPKEPTMWNASAISASEWTAKPVPSSSRKKRVSMTSITLMRVDFDHRILAAIFGQPQKFKKEGDRGGDTVDRAGGRRGIISQVEFSSFFAAQVSSPWLGSW